MKSAALSARRLRLSRCWGALGLLAWAAAAVMAAEARHCTLRHLCAQPLFLLDAGLAVSCGLVSALWGWKVRDEEGFAWAAAGLVPGLAIALTLAGALLLRPVWSFRLPSSVGRLGGTPPPAASVVSVVRA